MITSLSSQDALRYEALKKQATTDALGFRAHARDKAMRYPRALRNTIHLLSRKDTSAYEFFSVWTHTLAPEIESLRANARLTSLTTTLSKQLNIAKHEAQERAQQLIQEQLDKHIDAFVDTFYGLHGRRYNAARSLLTRSVADVADARDRYISHLLYQHVAQELGMTVYDAHAPLFTRWRLRGKERRQIKRYKKQQAKRLKELRIRQDAVKAEQRGIIGRIATINLDTVLALDAYRHYKKRLEALKPTSRTPAKTLALFTATTKTIRDAYASTLTELDKLADLQYALKEVDSVLVEIFDMTDSERNALMVRLKEHRDLEREAARITKEQAAHP